ncbi:hypothetical protein R5O87_17165 [Arthrobacter globiformis]|uniref:hypothetical protein n=1 Tax=Arthrobacter globiformis TaxID=1665 RepID=UPI003978F6F9
MNRAIVDEKSPDSSIVWVLTHEGGDLMVPFVLAEDSPELVHPRKYLAPARTPTAQIDTAELKSIESTQAVMS